MRRRNVFRYPSRPERRVAIRRAVHARPRRATRRAVRRLFKYDGPSLHDICRIFSAYLRLAKAYDKKWNPPSRFKLLGTPEERARRFQEDLERAYGDKAVAAREAAAREQAATCPRPPIPPNPCPPPQSLTPNPAPKPKCDVTAVPLVRLPNGMRGLDWSKARPA